MAARSIEPRSVPAEDVLARLGHTFREPSLLREALTHRSFGTPNNERLEFVGDAVLNCAIALSLFERFPQTPEGDLSRARASLVNRDTLALLGRELGLGPAVRLGGGELKSGGTDRASIIADALEALIGAIFVDGGFDAARRAIDTVYVDLLRDADPATLGKDPKTRLQEFLQGRRLPVPEYAVTATTGEAHAQRFEVECRIPSMAIATRGEGGSRRAAEQDAAAQAIALAMRDTSVERR